MFTSKFYLYYFGLIIVAAILVGMSIFAQQPKIDSVMVQAHALDKHKFFLKEMNSAELINGHISGSFLFASGYFYGQVDQKQYLNVVYFDDEKITDSNKDSIYRVTKFNMEEIQIVTIPKNESPYFQYVGSSYQIEPDKVAEYHGIRYAVTEYKVKYGNIRLFLPDGWVILSQR